MKTLICAMLFLTLCFLFIVRWSVNAVGKSVNFQTPISEAKDDYQFPWPGILPDRTFLYKLKVFRNKIITKIIYSSVKRIEFDLLMADKTLYASKLLLDKGKSELAKETALKGENYFSILVSDYGAVLTKKQKVPDNLNQKITRAYEAQQRLITYLTDKAPPDDKETYRQVDYFSKSNYQSLVDLQKQKNRAIR